MLHIGFKRIFAALAVFCSIAHFDFIASASLSHFEGQGEEHASQETSPLSSKSDQNSAFSSIVVKGGSNGVMIVESKDARISLEDGQVMRHIFLDSDVFAIFWSGVLSDKFQYLRIDACRFFVLYDERDGRIYAYDWRGYKYLVSALDMSADDFFE